MEDVRGADAAQSESPSRDALVREAWIASVGILFLLALIKHLGAIVPPIGAYAFTIAAAIQLYIPILAIGKRGITRRTLGFTMSRWKEDLELVLALSIITIIPFAIGHHFWQTILFHRTFKLRLPDDLLLDAASQIFVVALAEETYFRGYLQERLARLWPARRKLFGAPFGAAIVVSAAVFALAHFVGEYRIDRLGPFFPALLFGLLRARTGTIVGAVAFHGFCNLLGEVLWACYRGS